MMWCLREFGYVYSSATGEFVPSAIVTYVPATGSLITAKLLGTADDIAKVIYNPSAIVPVTLTRHGRTRLQRLLAMFGN